MSDPEGYKEYIAANGRALASSMLASWRVVANPSPKKVSPAPASSYERFPTYQAALDCYRSPEYRDAMKLPDGKSNWDMAITEGYEGPQPPGLKGVLKARNAPPT